MLCVFLLLIPEDKSSGKLDLVNKFTSSRYMTGTWNRTVYSRIGRKICRAPASLQPEANMFANVNLIEAKDNTLGWLEFNQVELLDYTLPGTIRPVEPLSYQEQNLEDLNLALGDMKTIVDAYMNPIMDEAAQIGLYYYLYNPVSPDPLPME